jgi:hypothetical protein
MGNDTSSPLLNGSLDLDGIPSPPGEDRVIPSPRAPKASAAAGRKGGEDPILLREGAPARSGDPSALTVRRQNRRPPPRLREVACKGESGAVTNPRFEWNGAHGRTGHEAGLQINVTALKVKLLRIDARQAWRERRPEGHGVADEPVYRPRP